MSTSIKITGIRETIKELGKYNADIAKEVDRKARATVASIVADGKRRAPVKTGFLRANIRLKVKRDFYTAISNANYSASVDKRKPYFLKQADEKLQKYIIYLKQYIKRK